VTTGRTRTVGVVVPTYMAGDQLGRCLRPVVDADAADRLVGRHGAAMELVVHCAAQPSHDWAAREPLTDIHVHATGTLNLLEATRSHAPGATFTLLSTNKVHGDAPKDLPLVELETRWELDPAIPWAEHGFDETLRIDQSKHSLFGASKVAADVMGQEYGRYSGASSRSSSRCCAKPRPTSPPSRPSPSTTGGGSGAPTRLSG
jgi:nucleoside-diphosphate-sugar epimerase